jgi:hypothetical protein
MAGGGTATAADRQLTLLPDQIELFGPRAAQRVLAEWRVGELLAGTAEAGGTVLWSSGDPSIVQVQDGIVTPQSDGCTTVTASVDGQTATAQVVVRAMDQPPAWEFRRHVLPVLSKAGCNSGACHGALAGKGGYKLSLGAYHPTGDFFRLLLH